MDVKIYCPDIECESCVKLISRSLDKLEGVDDFSVDSESVRVSYNPDVLDSDKLISLIHQLGFRSGLQPFPRKTFLERWGEFRENKKKYEVEYKMLQYSGLTFLSLILLQTLVYFGLFRLKENFLAHSGWWLFYGTMAIVSIGSGMWHMKSYRAKFTSMTGMMIGMTFGMQTGMMIGSIIGASNGLFLGGTVGMLAAVLVGVYNGKCCGIMGVMEGTMAGIMGGIMGSMIGVMFSVDHILYFMPLFMLLNLSVMFGLSYMLFEEVVEHNPATKKKQVDFLTFFSYCLLAVAILTVVIVYGPKTGLAGVI